MFKELQKEIKRIKENAINPQPELFRVYGKCQMALTLSAITLTEFMKLNYEVVADGINNPKYF